MFSKIELRSKKVLITGGAQGLGKSLAREFLNRGAELLVCDLNVAALQNLKDEFAVEFSNDKLLTFKADVTNEQDLHKLKDFWLEKWGAIDILVNNAGIVYGGPFLEVPLENHLKIFEVNLLGLIRVTHLFLPELLKSKEACLLQIGSVTGLIGLAYGSTYASSKWGVLGFSESIRQELRATKHKNLHICVVCPSYIDTGMFEGSGAPLLMPFLKPDLLARKIIRAVESKTFFVKEPFLVKTAALLRAALPIKIQDWVFDFLGVADGMKDWKGHCQKKDRVAS